MSGRPGEVFEENQIMANERERKDEDRKNVGGPSQSPKDRPTDDRDNPAPSDQSAQSQSRPIGDEERDVRAEASGEERGRGTNPRTGSDSNQSRKNRGG